MDTITFNSNSSPKKQRIDPRQVIGGTFEDIYEDEQSTSSGSFSFETNTEPISAVSENINRSFSAGSLEFTNKDTNSSNQVVENSTSKSTIQEPASVDVKPAASINPQSGFLNSISSGTNFFLENFSSAANSVTSLSKDISKEFSGAAGELFSLATGVGIRKEAPQDPKKAGEKAKEQQFLITKRMMLQELAHKQQQISLEEIQKRFMRIAEGDVSKAEGTQLGYSTGYEIRKDMGNVNLAAELQRKRSDARKASDRAKKQQTIAPAGKGKSGNNLSTNLSAQEGQSQVANAISTAG